MSKVVDPISDKPVDDLEQDIVQDKPEPSIPEKYAGKSAEDLVAILQDQETYIGRQSSEIGNLRKTVDQALQLNTRPPEQDKKPAVDVDSLLDDPEKAVNSAIEHNPRLNAIEQKLLKQELSAKKASFESKHDDWQQVVVDQKFRNWVSDSPVRQEMFKAADQNYNYEVADELFTTWKQIQQAQVSNAEQQRVTQRNSDLRAATTETGVSSPASKKRYRRAELVALRNDPEKWDLAKDDVYRAYKEGRVYD